MREINECTAEVFRRSEKRIKERKRNRNRIDMYPQYWTPGIGGIAI